MTKKKQIGFYIHQNDYNVISEAAKKDNRTLSNFFIDAALMKSGLVNKSVSLVQVKDMMDRRKQLVKKGEVDYE